MRNTARISGSARSRCVVSAGIFARARGEPPPTPNPVKTLGYSCLDIVKPHFQHRHYVKHVAEADKSNNRLASPRRAANGGRRGLKTFRSSARLDLAGRSDRSSELPFFSAPPAPQIDLSRRARTSSSAANLRNLSAKLVP